MKIVDKFNSQIRQKWQNVYNHYVEYELHQEDSPYEESFLVDEELFSDVCNNVFLPIFKEGGNISENDEDLYSSLDSYWLKNSDRQASEQQVNEQNDWYSDVLYIEKFGRK